MTFSHNSTGYTFAPVISGSGSLDVTLGTTVLTGDSSGFSGTTTIGAAVPALGRGGILQIADGGFTGALGGNIVDDNQLVIDRAGTLTLAGIQTGASELQEKPPEETLVEPAKRLALAHEAFARPEAMRVVVPAGEWGRWWEDAHGS